MVVPARPHQVEPGAQAGRELFARRLAHRPHSRKNTAAFLLNFRRRNSAQLLLPIAERVARPARVGVTVDKAGHEHAPVGFDYLCIRRGREFGADRGNFAFCDQHVAPYDHAEVTHRRAAPWAHATLLDRIARRLGESQDTGVSDKQTHEAWPILRGTTKDREA